MPEPSSASGAPDVRLERFLPAEPARVFAAWTEPGLMARWMSPRGRAEVSLDLRIGGSLEVVMIDGTTRIEHRGTFLEVDPPRRIRFTWLSEHTAMTESIVTVELTPDAGGTRLLLRHERLPATAAASHAGGWGAMVDRLRDLLPGPSAREVPS